MDFARTGEDHFLWAWLAGVLTKLDIMDRGTDAAAILRNEVVPLRLGYIGMVNRSQADINTRRSIRDAIAAETQFFDTHPAYQEVRFAAALRPIFGFMSHSGLLMGHILRC